MRSPSTPRFLVLVLFLNLLNLVSSASNPTSFCKCTCGANSTIIPLDAPSSSSSTSRKFSLQLRSPFSFQKTPQSLHPRTPNDDDQAPTHANADNNDQEKDKDKAGKEEEDNTKTPSRRKTCNDCNKQYCLNQGLHICKDKALEDIYTTCFQRDSRKDEAVVFIFIAGTASLLGWAAVKPWVGKWID
ncbi:MAG: hypothetical protein Q9200_005894, partial [Gallowayella weberi]